MWRPVLEFLTESADIFSIEPLCFLRRSKDGDNNGETAVKGFNAALSSFYQCCLFVLQSQCVRGMIRFDDLCFVFCAFQEGEGPGRGRPQSGNGKTPDKRDVTRSTTATRMLELAWKTRKSKACFAGYELVNSSLVWYWVTQPNVHPKIFF